MRRLWGRRCSHKVEELAIAQFVGRDPIALIGRVGILAHDERGIVLTIADGGVGRFLVVSVILTANQF